MKKYISMRLLFVGVLFLVGCGEEVAIQMEEQDSVDTLSDEEITWISERLYSGLTDDYEVAYNEAEQTFFYAPLEEPAEGSGMREIIDNPDEEAHKPTLERMASSFEPLSNELTEDVGEGIRIALKHPEEDSAIFYIEDGEIEYPIFGD